MNVLLRFVPVFWSDFDFLSAQVNRYFSTQSLQYYFHVSNEYVKNKIRIILFPFLHRVSPFVAIVLDFLPVSSITNG